jgi:murein DD-endopeptidase MepM/ murein hydrolase activator NlpD
MPTKPIKQGVITSPYGNRIRNGVKEFHPGIDIGVNGNPVNVPVHCAKQGVIAYIDNDHPVYDPITKKGSFGRVVYVKLSDNWYSIYPHMSLINYDLKAGQSIMENDFIGIMGNTGISAGLHIHYEERTGLGPGGSRCPQDIIDLYKTV